MLSLLDGTRVELGVDSRLHVGAFERGTRTVELEGEAVFDVVHDDTRPFRVVAKNAVVEDLGTTFGVRAYASDENVRVAVVSGTVAMRARERRDTSAVVLGPNDLARLSADGSTDVERNVDVSSYLAWTKEMLVFRRASLKEVAAELERWYDVDIRLADTTLAARRLTIVVPARSLDQVLDAATFALGLRYKREGRAVVITTPK